MFIEYEELVRQLEEAQAENERLRCVAENFEINGPDDDGLVWLVLHGNGTTGKAMFNLGKDDMIAVQVARHLEADRIAAISKVTK